MIKRALLSVSDKTNLLSLAQFLQSTGVEIVSTGGTATMLRDAGVAVKDVSELTGMPEMLDGRVKTLHPKVHGGLLGIRDNAEHQATMREHGIAPIDLVVINLYPFEETLAKGGTYDECIENIDIGGPAMIRSSAKNHADVTVIVDPADYVTLKHEMQTSSGATTLEFRQKMAAKAFARTAAYDAAISGYFRAQLGDALPESISISGARKAVLHYGENPHQKAALYSTANRGPSLLSATQVQGEALSYNNVNDASAALELAAEFTEPCVAIIKHANPCGVATGKTIQDAYKHAFACDKVSAYGGIIAINQPLTLAFAEAIKPLFLEVLIAPSVDENALALLATKKKLKLLTLGTMPEAGAPRMAMKLLRGGFLLQEEDTLIFDEAAANIVTKTKPSKAQMADLRFAFTVAKHVKSNAIVLAKNGSTIGIGAGQMSRIDSTHIAVHKAGEMQLDTKGAVLASDAFFPFSDNVELAAKSGVSAIIQPGGSIRDEEVIAAADAHGIAMVFTGKRHFRH
jgi:phosphoribosylaminoimidazolecarboxamide formyltransferase / IMP cyclohydrolase